MKVIHSLALTLAAAAPLAGPVSADELTPQSLWGSPTKGVDFNGQKYMKEAKSIVVPTAHVMMMNWGKITAVTQTSALQSLAGKANSTARSTTEVVVPLDPAVSREIADALYKDLVEKLRAGGWEVKTHADVKDIPAFANAAQDKVDSEAGVVLDTVTVGKEKTRYVKVAPEGMPVLKHGLTGPLFPLRNAFKEIDSGGLIVTYRFEPVAMQAESKRGLSENTASTSLQANLQMDGSMAMFVNQKMAGGMLIMREPRQIGENVGVVAAADDKSPKVANAISGALSALSGFGSINSKKSQKVVAPDVDALRAKAIEGGKAFNTLLVNGLSEAK